jgi:hypothetical protein
MLKSVEKTANEKICKSMLATQSNTKEKFKELRHILMTTNLYCSLRTPVIVVSIPF